MNIDRIEIREVRMENKGVRIKRRKSFEINEESQATKEQPQTQSDIGDVIRRRKGEPDKRISLELNKQ